MAFDRRGFLKFAIGGAIGSLFTPIPWKLADDISIWTQNWPWIPRIPRGEMSQKRSILKLGATPYGIWVHLVNNRPITVSGDKNHPQSLGGIDPVGASCVPLLYSPMRINGPMKKDSNGKFKPISWNEAEKILSDKIKKLGNKKNKIAFISGDETSSANEVFSSFLSQLNSQLYFYEPSDRVKYFKGWYTILNGDGEVGFDLENADYVLALGCNFLDSWGSYVRNQKIFGTKGFDLQYVGPYKDNTSVVAQKTIFVSEKDLYKFALGVAYYLISWSPTLPGVYGIGDFIKALNKYFQPDKVAKDIGCSPQDIKEVAKGLLNAKSPLVLAGSNTPGGGPIKNIVSALILNILLNRVNKKGGIKCIPYPPKVISSSMEHKNILKNDLIVSLKKEDLKNTEIIFFYESNPIYSLPRDIRDELLKPDFKVSFSQFMDETAKECDLLVPAPYFLERMDDCFTPFGSSKANYSVCDKIVSPVVDSKNPCEFILKIAKKMKLNIPVNSFKSLIKTKAEYLGETLDKLLNGNIWSDPTTTTPYALRIWSNEIKQMFSEPKETLSTTALELVPIKMAKTGTCRTGLLPFSLDVIYEDELPKHGVYVYINPKTALDFHLQHRDIVKITSKTGTIKGIVYISNEIKPRAIGILSGLGRKLDNEFNKNIGVNIIDLFETKKETGTNSYMWSPTLIEIG